MTQEPMGRRAEADNDANSDVGISTEQQALIAEMESSLHTPLSDLGAVLQDLKRFNESNHD